MLFTPNFSDRSSRTWMILPTGPLGRYPKLPLEPPPFERHTWWLPRLSNGYGDNLVVTTTTLCCLSDYSYCMVCMFISQCTFVKLFICFFLIENPAILGLNLISIHLHLPINVNIELSMYGKKR